jgi:hypothetical protein
MFFLQGKHYYNLTRGWPPASNSQQGSRSETEASLIDAAGAAALSLPPGIAKAGSLGADSAVAERLLSMSTTRAGSIILKAPGQVTK